MGILHSNHLEALSHRNIELCNSIFADIDSSHNCTIDINEAKEWWKNSFSIINARAMFEAVDFNHDGIIDLNEWISFWTMVKHKGHTDEEITEELMNIKNKLSWVYFEGVAKLQPSNKD
jgi:Ca2+-binding EF-hand superfamily protein